MKNKFLTIVLAGLVLLSALNFFYVQSTLTRLYELDNTVANLPKDPIVYVGTDGYTPKKGIDYKDGNNGSDGINAISFNKTVIKEVPLVGTPGADGKNGKDYDWRFNAISGNFEVKGTTDDLWQTAITCDKFVSGCDQKNNVNLPIQPDTLESH